LRNEVAVDVYIQWLASGAVEFNYRTLLKPQDTASQNECAT